MTRFIPLLVAFFFFSSPLDSQSYYVKYDPECMDRYELVTDIDKTPYVVYTVHSGMKNLIQLDVGKEPVKWVKNLPAKLTACSFISFDKALALAINNSTAKVYIVRQSPTHYNIAVVEKATIIHSDNQQLEVTMADADFAIRWDKLVSNINLATPASTKEVYLEGIIRYQCLTGYIFKKKNTNLSEGYKEYIIIPEMGIVSKRPVPYEGAVTNSLQVNKVDDQPFMDFILNNFCNNLPPPTTTSRHSAATTDNSATTLTVKGNDIPTSYNNNGPCPPASRPGIHVVQKGETLYGISKRYGISVDQIKAWNGIKKGNIIRVCQELVISQQPQTPKTTPSSGSNTSTTPKATSQSYHIVKPGETVEQLATMYGYTEERFRKMNGLAPYERVYPGQKLFSNDCNCPNTEGVAADTPMPYETDTERLTDRGNPDVYFRPVKVHEVKEGETLFSIARLYDSTVDRIRELNGLDKKVQLKKGQRIYVQ